ncbi:hypothetical protein FQN54_001232 [Arachnomyces sp. PD_36]|nr:hypothetical protein FQN54_001232 [Arachnomyces sp. PD_36]
MEFEFPPLPPPRIDGPMNSRPASTRPGIAKSPENGSINGKPATPSGCQQPRRGIDIRVLADDSDVVLHWAEPSPSTSSRPPSIEILFHVPSAALMEMNPYFSVLLDPNKFSEGGSLADKTSRLVEKYGSPMRGRLDQVQFDELPKVEIGAVGLIAKHVNEADVFEFFLRMLICASGNKGQRDEIVATLALKPAPFLASLIVVAEHFNGPDVLKTLMKESRCAVNLTKDKLLKSVGVGGVRHSNEERIRQALYVGVFLDHHRVTCALSHALIMMGSKVWFCAGDDADSKTEKPIWWHFPEGIEEELYYRHQCILHTIADLQTHFLNLYGALNHPSEPGSAASNSATRQLPARSIQCRWGAANSIACDSFHLGEYIRFLSLRTGTLSLESTLIDPDLGGDSGYSSDLSSSFLGRSRSAGTVGVPTDINALLIALRQCPDYQIDSGHSSCGIRRRLNPLLDYIEVFAKSEHTVGLCLTRWRDLMETESWSTKYTKGNGAVNVSHSKMIDSIMYPTSGDDGHHVPICWLCDRHNKKGRALFTARKRVWDS